MHADTLDLEAGASFFALGLCCGWRPPSNWLRLSTRPLAARIEKRTIGLLLLIALVWLSHFTFPEPTGEPGLDSSWQEVKGYELVHGWQAGVDTVFTFGPLGYFTVAPYNGALFWTKVVWWEIAFKLVLTSILVLTVRRAGGPIEKTVLLLAILLLFPGEGAFFFTMVIAISIRVLGEPRGSGRWAALGFLCLSLIALVKFTFFMLAILCVALIAVQRMWVVSWKSAARTCALYGVILASVWTLLGQSLLHLPRYVQSSSWIARGYNEGMTWSGPGQEVSLAYGVVALIGAVALLQGLQRPRDKTVWIGAALLCSGAFAALKAGFVRHGGNSLTFFGCAAVSTFLLPALEARAGRERTLRGMQVFARLSCALLSTYGCVLSQGAVAEAPTFLFGRWSGDLISNAKTLLDLPSYRARLEDRRRRLEEIYALPRIRAAVGREPVDVFGSNQSLALLNGLNYRPRPVFQSYAAYAPELIELNARFLEGDRAPRFVLFEHESLENRLPCSEDGLALQVLMRDYTPRFSEAGILLLERAPDRPAGASDPRHLVLEKTIAFGETLDLDRLADSDAIAEPGRTELSGRGENTRRSCLVIAMDIRSTLRGKLRAALIKGTPVYMDYTLDSGETRSARIVPGMVRTGVLVSPLLDSQDAWVRWFCGEHVSRISSFRLTPTPGAEDLFDPRIAVRVMRDDTLVPRVDPGLAEEMKYSMFSVVPEYVRSNPPPFRSRIRNLEVLCMAAPAEMGCSVPPGQHSIRARFGMTREAFKNHCSDGAGFSVVARDGLGTETVLFHRLIDESVASHGAPQELQVTFETPARAELLFRIDPGPRGDAACDWAYWSEVSIADAAKEHVPK